MLDAQSIFIYKAIKKCNPSLKIFSEMFYSTNIEFLMPHTNSKFLEIKNTTLFAAGEVYISTIIDTLTA